MREGMRVGFLPPHLPETNKRRSFFLNLLLRRHGHHQARVTQCDQEVSRIPKAEAFNRISTRKTAFWIGEEGVVLRFWFVISHVGISHHLGRGARGLYSGAGSFGHSAKPHEVSSFGRQFEHE